MPSHELIPVSSVSFGSTTKPGVSAKALYDFLGLNTAAWARWAKKNILTNPYAIEHEDWEKFTQHDVENGQGRKGAGHHAEDYVLSLDLAKKLAMMARSAKGEEARNYFLACEAIARQETLPQVHDYRTEVTIKTLLRLDAAEYRLAQVEASAKEAELKAAKAETKADMALDDAHRMTVEEFVAKNGLIRQFPESTWKAAAAWVSEFCLAYGLKVAKVPVPGKAWQEENAYPLQALMAWLRYATRRDQGDMSLAQN